MENKSRSKNIRPSGDTPANTPAPAPATEAEVHGFFTPQDWIAAAIAFLVSGFTYFYYMSPCVTLQDSGELVTGAFNFGVPHPPGYPLWAFMGWVWGRLVPFGNPAWRTCLFSVLTGAALVGFMTLLMTRSILMLLRNSPWAEKVEDPLKHWVALTVGTCASMLFAFNRGVWLWACVPEMRVLNQFLFVALTCVFFAWMMRPERHGFLYVTLLLLGLSIANHQTIVVMAVPILAGAFVVGWTTENVPGSLVRRLTGFWEMTVGFLFGWAVGLAVNAWLEVPQTGQMFSQKVKCLILFGPEFDVVPLLLLSGGGAAALLALGGSHGWLNRRRALICTALFLLGCSFYLYMPLASSTNPPMNWGYAATKQGFLHTVTRGQYERLHTSSPLSSEFYVQVGLFVRALVNQYSFWIAIFGLVPVAMLAVFWRALHPRARQWLIFVLASFATASVGLLMIINPGLDKTQQEITIKFFAPAHGFYAMLIGYGFALTVSWALARWHHLPRLPLRLACVALLVLPIIPFQRNWTICEQRGHDFGYQFGYRMFYPGGDYPPMEKDAVLFGGTDPGRFVPTYMIFCESRVPGPQKFHDPHLDPTGGGKFDRRDVYIITQNALADATYMSYIRDHYDYSRPTNYNAFSRWLGRTTTYPVQPIYIPTPNDLQRAFQEYVSDVEQRRRRGQPLSPEEQVDISGGQVQVRGVAGVMNINGILCKWIHQRNKAKHTFYVEESYVIPWMYDYLEPFGIIMKINKDPLPTPQQNPALWAQIVARDKKYWDKLCAEFATRAEFRRDSDAQKTFSKLRSAIGGLYSSRHMPTEALYAFRQALQLCPESPEANFRLAQLCIEAGRPDEAIATLETYQKLDPLNAKVGQALEQIRMMKQQSTQLQQLEKAAASAPRNVTNVMRLAQAYASLNQTDKLSQLFDRYLTETNTPANDMLQIAQIYLQMNQPERCFQTLQVILSRYPQNSDAYTAMAIIRAAQSRTNEAVAALQKAIQFNPGLRDAVRNDPRFNNIRSNATFQQLVKPPAPPAKPPS